MNIADLDPETRRKLGIEKAPKKQAPNEFEDLFRFQCMAMKLPKWEEQYPFGQAVGRGFLADFFFVEFPIIVEIHGGIWRKGGGAHSRPAKIISDMRRQRVAVLLGYFIAPFTTDEVRQGRAIDETQEILRKHGWCP